MSKHKNVESFHLARDTVGSDTGTRRKNRARPKTEASTEPQFFVPSFSVRRKVLVTEEVQEFMGELKKVLPRNYRVFRPDRLAMTIVEQKRLIDRFRQAKVQPSEEVVESVARNTSRELKRSLNGVPRSLSVSLGRVDRFGSENEKNKIGIIPRGWKGYTSHYAEKDATKDKNILPMPVIVRETNICLGGLVTAFSGNENLERGIRLDGIARTPHISLARKERGGPISHSEIQAVSAIVEEIAPEGIELFDPVIYLRVAKDQHEPISIYSRSPRLSQFGPFLEG